MTVQEFLKGINELAQRDMTYVLGKSGQNNECDCIGLIRHGVEAAGGKWDGIHGSNWCARYGTVGLKEIVSDAELSVGDLVYKRRLPGDPLYALPGRYQQGGSLANGDMMDYCHIGVVTGTYPLRITHMSTGGIAVDKKIGKWAYFGRGKWIDGQGDGEKMTEKVTIGGGKMTSPINMRWAASTGSKLIDTIPQGSQADMISWGPDWCEIRYNGETGYVKTEFVHREGETTGQPAGDGDIEIHLSEAEARQLLPILDRIAQILVDAVGRG